MIHRLKKRRPNSVLTLQFDGGQLDGVVLRRTNGSVQVLKSFSATLSLDLLKNEPELVAREIRNQLDQAGVRERRCAVCLPQAWALFLHTKLPELPEEDVISFLEIEAERGFPYPPEALSISVSRLHLPGGEESAGQVAVSRDSVERLEKVLRLARLVPLTFSLPVSAVDHPEADPARAGLALHVGENSVALQVSAGGGIAALRTLESVFENESGSKRFFADVIAREIRVTLGQIPASIRNQLHQCRVYGRGRQAERLAEEIRPRAESMGLRVEHVTRCDSSPLKLPENHEISPELCLGMLHLAGRSSPLEFLPPRISSWRHLVQRYSARKLAWAGSIAAAAAVLLLGAFGWQQWQLSLLESRWAAMRAQVERADHVQGQIKRFRPWFDDSFRTLVILRKLTEAFPETGVVTAKTLEIREGSLVVCSGEARDQQAFLRMLDQLRGTAQFGNVTVDQVRGQNPMQFSFSFQWGEGRDD